MKNFIALFFAILTLGSCENPYDLVSESKTYKGDPFVMLSSEQAAIRLGISQNNNHSSLPGIFRDSLVLSNALDHDLTITLELVGNESFGALNEHFKFQDKVIIDAGSNYGSFTVHALDIPISEISKYKLSSRIKETDDPLVIAGLYGSKKENEERQKRFKTYSFQE